MHFEKVKKGEIIMFQCIFTVNREIVAAVVYSQ